MEGLVMTWPLDAYSLMWVQIATGFTGALTLVYLLRMVARRIGWISELRPYFSPKGGCTDAIVAELKKARRELLVQAYSFTSDPITNELVAAKSRGVVVTILLDKSNESDVHSDIKQFLDHKLDPLVDHEHAIAHNKVMIVDGRTLMTGSFNFTNQAEHENAENLLILRGVPEIIAHYRESFMKHKAHCKPAALKAAHESRPHPKKVA
jgi:phosphatidylserine/phosphatidylglycerophosphate/cardiolipin synthase-like enzyme